MELSSLAKLCGMSTTIFRYTIYAFCLFALLGCRRAPAEIPPTTMPTATAVPAVPEMTLTVEMPLEVELGARFNVVVRVGNLSADPVENLTVMLPIPAGTTEVNIPVGSQFANAAVQWEIAKMEAGAILTELITLQAPFETSDHLVPAAQLTISDQLVASAEPQPLQVAGGTLPIAIARARVGEVVNVIGAVTYYQDGTFYVTDETGGIRVQSPVGAPNLTFELGQMIAVAGEVVSAGERVAILLDAEMLDAMLCNDCAPLETQPNDHDFRLGQLVTTTGTVREIVAVADGEQITLEGDDGNSWQIWIVGGAGISADTLTIGQQATIVGIYDEWDSQLAIAPRLPSDITPIFNETLRLTFDAPASVSIDRPITHTLTLHNESDEPRTNLVVSAAVPRLGGELFAGAVITNSGNGQLGTDGVIYWGVPELAAQSTHTFTYQIQYFESGMATTAMAVRGDEQIDEVLLANTLYVGQPVPIVAIQVGESSPMRGREVLIEGIVTHVAAERGGFFMQQSADILIRGMGIFVETVGDPTVSSGDSVLVRGIVRERNGETIVAEMRDGIVVPSSGNPLPEALPFDPDTDDLPAYFEPFEGMLISLNEPMITISDTTAAGVTAAVFQHDFNDANYVMHLLTDVVYLEGEEIAPFVGVVSAEFDQYIIIPIADSSR